MTASPDPHLPADVAVLEARSLIKSMIGMEAAGRIFHDIHTATMLAEALEFIEASMILRPDPALT